MSHFVRAKPLRELAIAPDNGRVAEAARASCPFLNPPALICIPPTSASGGPVQRHTNVHVTGERDVTRVRTTTSCNRAPRLLRRVGVNEGGDWSSQRRPFSPTLHFARCKVAWPFVRDTHPRGPVLSTCVLFACRAFCDANMKTQWNYRERALATKSSKDSPATVQDIAHRCVLITFGCWLRTPSIFFIKKKRKC